MSVGREPTSRVRGGAGTGGAALAWAGPRRTRTPRRVRQPSGPAPSTSRPPAPFGFHVPPACCSPLTSGCDCRSVSEACTWGRWSDKWKMLFRSGVGLRWGRDVSGKGYR
jgi:hypothetical protein